MPHNVLPIFFLLMVFAPGAPAHARSRAAASQAKAARLVKKGEKSFRKADYETAIKRFKNAERTLDRGELAVPPLLYRSMARCYDQLGQIVAAYSMYKRFLAGADPRSKRLKKAIKQAKESADRLSRLLDGTRLSFDVEPVGSEVRVDRREVGTTPIKPVKVNPGPHFVSLWAKGHEPLSIKVDVAPGATVPIIARLIPSETVARDAGEAYDSWSSRGPALGAAGVAAALTVGAGLFFLSGQAVENDGDKLRRDSGVDGVVTDAEVAAVQAKYDEGADDRGVALGLAAGGAVFAVAAWWLWPDGSHDVVAIGAEPLGAPGAPGARLLLSW